MEVGAHVWLRTPTSQWGWVPARIVDREEIPNDNNGGGRISPEHGVAGGGGVVQSNNTNSGRSKFGTKKKKSQLVKLTLKNDTIQQQRSNSASSTNNNNDGGGFITPRNNNNNVQQQSSSSMMDELNYFSTIPPFIHSITVDSTTLANADHPDIKLRNLPTSHSNSGGDTEASVIASPSTQLDSSVVGGVHDLIGLTHLHEPAILHALRLRYDSDIIYTSTGPILIAINPFERMDHLYCAKVMENYRVQGEGNGLVRGSGGGSSITPFKAGNNRSKGNSKGAGEGGNNNNTKLPPHAYKTADDAYRAMKRGLENSLLMTPGKNKSSSNNGSGSGMGGIVPTNQSILVSGESGAGKTVTTKIVLNYFAMLSKQITAERKEHQERSNSGRSPMFQRARSSSSRRMNSSPSIIGDVPQDDDGEVCIEQQVLQSNPILESFGNARTLRNDNSSRFGKYIDIKFTPQGKLSGATIETYLLEKVRLIHPSVGERNYHVFYQFLEAASVQERVELGLEQLGVQDFRLLNGTGGVYDRRDGVNDGLMHGEMLDAMVRIIYLLENCSIPRVSLQKWILTLTQSCPPDCSSHLSLLGHNWFHVGYHHITPPFNRCHSTLWQHHLHGTSSIECPGYVRCMFHG